MRVHTNAMKILLVEDNAVDALVFNDELSQLESEEEFQVTVVERVGDIADALEQEQFDLIVLDLGLADSTGLETYHRAREIVPDIPVVVMSGLADEEVATEAVRNGAQDYVIKDRWNRMLLARSLRYAVERHRLLEELKASQEQLRAVFNSAQDLIYIKDENLRLVSVNPAVEKMAGHEGSEITGGKEEDLFGKETAEQIKRWDLRVLMGETIEEEHTRNVDGRPLTFLDVRVPLRNIQDQIVGVCCISRDITERTRAVRDKISSEPDYPSKTMRDVLVQARKIAATDGIVLLLGESGSGKDYLARWIHDHSNRSNGPYFALNCAALTRELAESELFGHERGAFTGALGRKKGLLELAEGGTILLNEIGELPLSLQSKLLTFLDTMSFVRVGGEKTVSVDARLMAATHRDLKEEVAQGRFLEPLFYRLNVFTIEVPPLRERKEDIPFLVEETIADLAEKMNLSRVPVIDVTTIEGLTAYNWPGNVREMRNIIERALMLWDGGRFELKLHHSGSRDHTWSGHLPFPAHWSIREVSDEIIKSMCMEALRRTGANKKAAAKLLGISREALYRYIRRFKIKPEMLS